MSDVPNSFLGGGFLKEKFLLVYIFGISSGKSHASSLHVLIRVCRLSNHSWQAWRNRLVPARKTETETGTEAETGRKPIVHISISIMCILAF